jgi:nickel-dependent lactate racemase
LGYEIKNQFYENGVLSDTAIKDALKKSVDNIGTGKKILLLPPDFTRMYSGAGKIAAYYYELLNGNIVDSGNIVDVMPALGTHEPMTEDECNAFFLGKIPYDRIIKHNWRTDVVKLGEIPADFVTEVSEELVKNKIDVEVNKRIVSGDYDLIISIGQVVPHEVVGMANYSKNIFVGCGGSSMINSSHMLGAFYGMERIMGKDFSPVRKVFDYAEERFINNLPLMYVLTVTTNNGSDVDIHGLYLGRERALFERAVKLSQRLNFTFTDKPLDKTVVYLDPREFKSTWLGNKAIYRTRMAIADGGQLIILAPGVRKFGEDTENDRLIRKYGYVGREKILKYAAQNDDLQANLSVAAHLIHGSSDGRFSITYAADYLTKEEVEQAGFDYTPYSEAAKLYDPAKLTDGYNDVNGERIYYISNPALGLWDVRAGRGDAAVGGD